MSSDNYVVRVLAAEPSDTTFRVALSGNCGFGGHLPFGRAFALCLLAHGAWKNPAAHPWLGPFSEFGCVDEDWMRRHAPEHVQGVAQRAHAGLVASEADERALAATLERKADALLDRAPRIDLKVTWVAKVGRVFEPDEVFGTTGYDVVRENPPPYPVTRHARVYHRAGTSTVLGQAQAAYGLFADDRGATVTHLPTGMALAGPLEASRAEALLTALTGAAPQAGVECSLAPSEVPASLVDALRPIVRGVLHPG